MSTQLSLRNLSSSRPSLMTGPLISIFPPLLAFFFLLEVVPLRSRRLSILLRKLLALERVLLPPPLSRLPPSSPIPVFRSKVNCPSVSRGDGGIPSDRESSLAHPDPPVPDDEHMLATELARVAPAGTASFVRVAPWLFSSPLPPLPLLWIEPTSGCSLRSVSTLSELFPSRRASLPFWDTWSLRNRDGAASVARVEKTSSSSMRDQRLLSLWKVQRPLMAQGSSSSESSLWIGEKEGIKEREEEIARREEKNRH